MRILFIWLILCLPVLAQNGGVPTIGFTGGVSSPGCGAATGYTSTATITITAQGSLSADLPNNWVTYFGGNVNLKSTGNSGLVQSSGTDVVFCTNNNGTGTIIPYYFVPSSWSATTGAGEWYFQAPCIKKSSTCLAYLIIGKASASDFSCGPGGSNNCSSTLYTNYLRAYDFGGVSSGTLSFTDETGNAASPTNHGATSTAGEINNAANFAGGSSQWIDSGSTLPALTNFGMEAWVNVVVPPGSQQIFSMSNSDSGQTVGIFMIGIGTAAASCTANTCLGFGYHTTGSSYYYRWCSLGNSNPTGWHHLMGSHTAGSANLTMYVDGAASCTGGTGASGVQGGSPVDPGTSGSTFQMGRFGDSSTPFYYSGTHDEARVLKFAPTADEAFFDNLNQSNPTATYTVSVP